MRREHIPPRTGRGFEMARGCLLEIIDVEGGQVADLTACPRDHEEDWLSNGHTFDYNRTVHLTEGHTLYSARSRPLLTIVEDRVGRHDFLFAPCSLEMFRIQDGQEGDLPNCEQNLSAALAPFGRTPPIGFTPFNVFMNVSIDADGQIQLGTPPSRARDRLVLRAETDLFVAVSACSAAVCNDHRWTAIDVALTSPDSDS